MLVLLIDSYPSLAELAFLSRLHCTLFDHDNQGVDDRTNRVEEEVFGVRAYRSGEVAVVDVVVDADADAGVDEIGVDALDERAEDAEEHPILVVDMTLEPACLKKDEDSMHLDWVHWGVYVVVKRHTVCPCILVGHMSQWAEQHEVGHYVKADEPDLHHRPSHRKLHLYGRQSLI
jgi:hypothetical protein